jgi:hypothetical protein
MRCQCRLKRYRIRMRVSFEGRARQKSAIYQRCMTQPIQEHRFATPGQRGHHGQVRHVAGGKQQRSFTARERGKIFLQAAVFSTVAGNQMRSSATRAAASSAFRHCGRNSRMPCKAQVVIAGEVDELSPIDDRSYATPRLDESINRSSRATQMLTIELREGTPQLRRPALHLRP